MNTSPNKTCRWLAAALLAGAGLAPSALAGSATYDFNSDPGLQFVGNAEWRANGGVNDSGYVALFDAVNSQYAAVLIPDFDAGMVVKAFTFEVDLRVGNPVGNDGRPADGFSVNYARANDPVVLDLNQEPPVVNWNNYAIPGAPEGGTTTGLSICFDTWAGNTWPSGETDIEGIIVRVDNTTVARVPMATRNGSCTDATSLQTGPYNPDLAGAPDELCWAPLKVELAENGELTVTWKGTVIVDKVQTGFSPSAGRLVFAGRTGGANENTHIDNLRITTVPADNLVIGQANGTPTGFNITVSDSGPAVFNAGAAGAIVDFKLNGQSITPTRTSKTGGITTLAYANAAAPIPPGSANTVSLTVRDTRGLTVSKEVTFTGIAYTTLDPAWAATGVNTAQPGFTLRMYQVDFTDDRGVSRASDNANNGVSIASGERMLHGELGPNTADLSRFTGPGGTYRESKVINYNAATGNIGNFPEDGSVPGAVPSTGDNTLAGNFPGLPGTAPREGGNDDCTMELLTYIEFPAAGAYQLGVNSDDGFRLTAWGNPRDVLAAPIVAQFDNGRGAADTLGWVYVPQAGTYGFRALWMQGGGGANVELFSLTEEGTKVLLNDTTVSGALRAFAANSGAEPAAVTYVDPPRGSGRPFLAGASLVVEITDGASAVSNIRLELNGTEVTPTITKNGSVSRVVYTPAGLLPQGNNTLVVSFTDGAATYRATNTFTASGGAVIPPSMALKASDVNTANRGFLIKTWQTAIMNSGATGENSPGNSTEIAEAMVHNLFGWPNTANLDAFTGPGGSYVETGAINYNGASGDIGNFTDDGWYGGAPAPNMPGIPGSATLESGNANYALEIRTVLDLQPGTYHMGVNSDDGFRLIVGDGKEAYTLPVVCGEFSGGRGADNWGFTRFSIKVTQAGLYPFRMVFEQGGGGHNVEWFQIVEDGRPDQMGKVLINVDDPTTGARAIRAYQYPVNATGPTWVKSFAPGRSSLDSAGSRGRAGPDATVKAVLVDGSTPVDPASVSLRINGAAVTPTVTKTGGETTVTYKPEAGFAPGSTNQVALTFGDRTVSWSFIVNLPATPTFWIEAADFDYDGGQSRPEASVMPYAGGAYAGLGAVAGTDYKGFNTPDNPYYRYPNSLGVPMSFANDRDRGGGEVIVNFRPGWMGTAQWFNYTRNVPPGKYHIYAALSHGDANASIGGNLASVSGGSETILGVFDGLAPGGWGNNALLPLKDAATTNQVVALDLGGTQTFRYNDRNGDWDFLLFVPATEPGGEIRIESIVKNANGTITVTWSGGGTLQAAPTVLGPWQDVAGATSPYTFTPNEQMLFGRIRR